MNITINGTAKTLNGANSVQDIVQQFCRQPKNIITEVNGTIIPSNDWQNVSLKEGDTVELVTFVGGG